MFSVKPRGTLFDRTKTKTVPLGVSEFYVPYSVRLSWHTTLVMFSSNQKMHLSWEV